MELSEIQDKKKQLANDIALLLMKFEKETGLDVSSIDFVRQSSYFYGSGAHCYVVDPKVYI